MARRQWRRVVAIGAAALGGTALLAAGMVSAAPSVGIRIEVNGRAIQLAAPPLVVRNHVYLPLRFTAQLLGVPVHWDGANRTVYLGTAPPGSAGAASFTYQGMTYRATGLQVRSYPGHHHTSGVYWIVSYSVTNTTTAPVDVATTQPPLGLLGPGGQQLLPQVSLGGPAPQSVNPGITFSSYMVVPVPSGALPSAYGLGFDTYRVVNTNFQTQPVSAALPVSQSTTTSTPVSATYAVTNLWNRSVQDITIGQVVQTTAILPNTSSSSFDPGTTLWIVNFSISNPNLTSISFTSSNFALNFGGELDIAPLAVASVPGYFAQTDLSQPGGVLLASDQSFSGALAFAVPRGTPISSPSLSIRINGQQRLISLTPCTGNICPPIGN